MATYPCGLTGGRRYVNCGNKKMSGIKRIYLLPFSSTTSSTLITNSDNVITGFGILSASPYTWYAFDTIPQTSGWKSNGVGDIQKGTGFFNEEVTFQINTPTATDRNQTMIIFQNSWHIMAQRMNDTLDFLGEALPLDANKIDGGSGTKVDDPNSIVITWTGVQPEYPKSISSSTVFNYSY